jgi:hypothetical protein
LKAPQKDQNRKYKKQDDAINHGLAYNLRHCANNGCFSAIIRSRRTCKPIRVQSAQQGRPKGEAVGCIGSGGRKTEEHQGTCTKDREQEEGK